MALFFGKGIIPSPLEYRTISREKMVTSVAHKSKNLVQPVMEVIEEDPSDSPGLPAMRQIEILIARILKSRIVGDRMALTSLFPSAMEVDHIFAPQVERR